jgi:hypothetical protein
MIRWIVFIGFVLLIDFYAFQSVKTVTKNKVVIAIYWLVSLVVLGNVIYQLNTFNNSKGMSQSIMFAFGLLILSITPKIIALIILFSEDVFRVFKGAFNYFSSANSKVFLTDRREFVSKIALGLAAIPFASIIYGMARGKYNYQVINHTLYFDDLPTAFDGFKITHISDIHSGSFDNPEKIQYAIDLINAQNSDLDFNSLIKRPTAVYFWSLKFYEHFKDSHYKVNELKIKYPEIDFIAVNIDEQNIKIFEKTLKNNRFSVINEFQFKNAEESKHILAIYPMTKVIIIDKDHIIVNSNANMFSNNFEEQLLGLISK